MKTDLDVPEAVRELLEQLEAAGFETWTVGGAVRDALRGHPLAREDWDLATRATPNEMRRLFRRTVPLGPEYGTVGVFGSDGELYEVTTFRHDVITYGRKAVVAFASSLEEDLARRDFTMNAIAWHPDRKLRDPHGGVRDLRDGVLRSVGDPAARFREDYLRVLRGLRFAGTLEMEIHPDTWTGMVAAVPGLAKLSMERVREELLKVLGASEPSHALALYERCGAGAVILPKLRSGFGRPALATIDAVRALRGRPGRRAEIRLAVLLLFGAAMRPVRSTVAETLRGLRFSKAETERVAAVVGGGLGPARDLAHDAAARRRWMAALGRSALRDVLLVWLAALRAGSSPADYDDVRRVVAATRRDHFAGVPMSIGEMAVAGRDLLGLGWSPGPEIGRVLQRLLEAVWQDPSLNDRATLLDLATSLDAPE